MCVNQKQLPTQKYLNEILHYHAASGLLFWKARDQRRFKNKRSYAVWNTRWAGKPAFRTKTKGYRAGKVDGVTYFAHRIIWKMVHGEDPLIVDHINRDPSDNRIENLRNVTQRENCEVLRVKASGAVKIRYTNALRRNFGGISRFPKFWKLRKRSGGRLVSCGNYTRFCDAVKARKSLPSKDVGSGNANVKGAA